VAKSHKWLSPTAKTSQVRRQTTSRRRVGFTKLRTECKCFGQQTKVVSWCLKVKESLVCDKTLRQECFISNFDVLIGCRQPPDWHGLVGRVGRASKNSCCSGSSSRWVSSRASLQMKGVCTLQQSFLLNMCAIICGSDMNAGDSSHVWVSLLCGAQFGKSVRTSSPW